jgi:hypothetical protein
MSANKIPIIIRNALCSFFICQIIGIVIMGEIKMPINKKCAMPFVKLFIGEKGLQEPVSNS